MKTSLTSQMVSGILALFTASAVAVQADPITPVQTTTTDTTAVQPVAAAQPVATTATQPQQPMATPVDLSPGAKEVIKLYQAGMATEVIKGYAETSGFLFRLSAEDIIYLNKMGVSNDTISAMLESDRVTQARQSLQAAQALQQQQAQQPQQPLTNGTESYPPPTADQVNPSFYATPSDGGYGDNYGSPPYYFSSYAPDWGGWWGSPWWGWGWGWNSGWWGG